MIIYTPPKTARSIPVIDLSPSFSDDPAARKAVGWEIHKACRETGFFYVSHHGVPDAVMAAQLAWTEKLFAMPTAEKETLDFSQSPRRLGYEPPLKQVLDAGSAPDLKESYMYAGRLDAPTDMQATDAAANLWPRDLDGFRSQMEAYHRAIGHLGQHLMGCLALSLDLDETYFEPSFAGADFSVRLLHYPPQSTIAAGNQMGAGAHTDWGGITMLLQDGRGGLEVQTADGAWIRATPIAGTFVINLGELLRRWTNDVYKSTLHRVLNNVSGHDRYSVATFFSPRSDAEVACIESCRSERPAMYPPITPREHMAEMVKKTYGSHEARLNSVLICVVV